jgi:hypothetical protein
METSWQQILKQASEGLLFPSESDYPFAYFEWDFPADQPLTEQTVRKQIQTKEETPVKVLTLDGFFKNVTAVKDWYGEEELAQTQKFKQLQEELQKNLSDVQVYKVGAVEIDAYIVGKTAEGKWAGLSTKVIET